MVAKIDKDMGSRILLWLCLLPIFLIISGFVVLFALDLLRASINGDFATRLFLETVQAISLAVIGIFRYGKRSNG